MALNAMDEPRALIQQTVAMFNPSGDVEAVHRISETMRQTEEIRKKSRQESQGVLRALSRKLESVKSGATRPPGVADEHAHAARMVGLDREKFALAKGINELEQNLSSLEAGLQQIRDEIAALEAEDAEEEVPPDQTVLKLQIYRSLGIELVEDAVGNYTKARIRSFPRNDIHTLVIDDKYSRFFYANYLWGMLL
ncbi:Spc24 subunit of Ndc80-domain-containing protein [Jimgerdemannia flammicorona]|uniref:Spc24 subunit of Ndc80-domain-containing protein n=2 Tax=Jimgerdemannia flammicorona TaxID=994334 RepID=A0A433D9L7_9FUNG|nr:Spc24 subunit of Ndc80-domain-containing protein [Jimgerdemannia flammicorona]RUS26453.1 Spc24 subunit of Ndc80-domain-containing protein [Jimgerdemannia flammicorona]